MTDLYTDNKAQMGLNPEGLPGIEKITTQYIPGDVGDLCNYNNPTLNSLTKEIEALPPSSTKLKSLWTPGSGLRHQERPLGVRRLLAERDRGGQGRDEPSEHPLRRWGLELLGGVGPGLIAEERSICTALLDLSSYDSAVPTLLNVQASRPEPIET